MTDTRFTWRWLFVFAAAGVVIGLVLGLLAGWAVPLGGSAPVDVSALSASAQNDYIVLVANSYAFDDDLPHAKQRLDLLKDSNIKARVEKLAKALNTRQDSYAANVADLAVALGSTDAALKVLAAQVTNNAGGEPSGEPTKVARVEDPPTATPKPTKAATAKVATDTPAATEPSAEPTDTPAKPTKAAATAAPKNTVAPQPQPTNPPAPAAALQPEWKPGLDQWWSGVKFVPASVAAGQQYWRLKSATFCDVPPAGAPSSTDTCPGMPGGPMDHTIYIGVLDAGGNCAQNISVKHLTNTGDTTPAEQKNAIYPWNSCNVDYEWNMYGEGNDIWIEGNGLPSDRLNGMVMNSPQLNWSSNKAHVRYFLVFQLTTR